MWNVMQSNKYIINSREVAKMVDIKPRHLNETIRRIFLKIDNKLKENFKEVFVDTYNTKNISQKAFSFDLTLDGVKLILDNKRKTPKMQPLYDFYNKHSNESHKVILSSRFEDEFFNKLKLTLEAMDVEIELQKHVKIGNKNYRLDGYLPKYNLVIEYDEKHHKFNKKEDLKREKNIKSILNCDFVRLDYEENDNYNIGLVMKKLMDKINR